LGRCDVRGDDARRSAYRCCATWRTSRHRCQCSLVWSECSLFWSECSLFWSECSLFWSKCSLFLSECSLFWSECSLFWSECSLFWSECSLFWSECSLFWSECSLFLSEYSLHSLDAFADVGPRGGYQFKGYPLYSSGLCSSSRCASSFLGYPLYSSRLCSSSRCASSFFGYLVEQPRSVNCLIAERPVKVPFIFPQCMALKVPSMYGLEGSLNVWA
jgi:hypothetical protein